MADEQIIYLSPEEELTNVRERLERVAARRIILVIPTQTQLRSHVSWRLLHARARELNKEVLIISSDRQIRSVVKAAGFKVADSLESPPSGKARLGSRPSRTGLGGRTSARLRTPPARPLPAQQTGGPDPRLPYQPPQPSFDKPAMQRGIDEKSPRREDTGRGKNTFESTPPASATFGTDHKQFAPGFAYNIGSSASIRPVVPSDEDEEPNLFLEDYQQAQSIRQAATNIQKTNADTISPPEHAISPEARPQIYDLPSTPHDDEGPFTYLEHAQSVPLREQHGSVPMASVPMDEIDDKGINPDWETGNPPDQAPDITDYPTDVLQVEDDGDQGDIVDRSGSSARSWTTSVPDEDQEQDIPGPSRVHGLRPRTNRSGKVLPPLPQPELDDDENKLPPVFDQQARVSPPPGVGRPSGTLSGGQVKSPSSPLGKGNRPPQAVSLPQPRAQQRTAQPPLKKRPTAGRTPPPGAIPRSPRQPAPSQLQRASGQRRQRSAGLPLLVVVLVLLLLGLLTYFGPSADVSMTLPSRSFALPMKLTATATSRQDVVHHTLPAHSLVFETSISGPGPVTGKTTVGTKVATGIVTFTNTGPTQIDIPTGTIVATRDSLDFVTTADALALPAPNNTIPAPIQAQTQGAGGNVPANSITSIPASSQSMILQANPGLKTVTLTVTNADPTTGGGAGSAASVSSNDVKAEQAVLNSQLQARVKQFLSQQVQPGDELGQPIETETPQATPAVGQVATNGTFIETLKLHFSVLVVRAADLQAAATAELKATLSKQNQGVALVPQQSVAFKQMKKQPSKDGTTLVLSFTAVGQVAPQISEETVRSLVSGKSVDDAKRVLANTRGLPTVLNTQITIYPGFFHWLPFWQQHIHVYFKTMPVNPAPKPKHR